MPGRIAFGLLFFFLIGPFEGRAVAISDHNVIFLAGEIISNKV